MRTATTIGQTRKGVWKLLAGPDVPLLQQRKEFRSFRAAQSHPELALVQYQETDGEAWIARLRTPKDQAAIEKKRAAQQAAANDAGRAETITKTESSEREQSQEPIREEVAA